MSRISVLKRSISTAVAGLSACSRRQMRPGGTTLSPSPPICRSARLQIMPRTATTNLPWLAPVGHRQPHHADVPRHETVSAWGRQQRQADHALDRKLIICRGCLPGTN
jgi:hypothetical protein